MNQEQFRKIHVIKSDTGGSLSKKEWNTLLSILEKKYVFEKRYPTKSQQRFIHIYENSAKWGESYYDELISIGITFSDFKKLTNE